MERGDKYVTVIQKMSGLCYQKMLEKNIIPIVFF